MERGDPQFLSRRGFLLKSGAIALAAGAASGAIPALARSAKESKTIDVEEMVRIPAGKFIMGTSEEQIEALCREFKFHHSWFDSEAPRREVQVEEFHIDKYPVTRGQYAKFAEETGRKKGAARGVGDRNEEFDLRPVVNVNWKDAKAYAQWAGKRLPTEAEWEKAARGAKGRIFPWGDKFDPEALNWNADGSLEKGRDHTTPVNRFPKGVSPYGVWDMCGNAAEWIGEGFQGSPNGIIKSAGWLMTQSCNFRPAFHGFSSMPQNSFAYVGFRCAK